MSPVIRQRYQANRDILERYRNAAQLFIWSIILILPGSLLLSLFGVPTSTAVNILYHVFFAASAYVLYTILSLKKVKPFVCECEGYDDSADTEIWHAWVCGFCAKTNPPFNSGFPWRRTFLDQCKKCERTQHSVLCWRCRRPLIWDENAFRREPGTSAWLLGYPPAAPMPEPAPEDRPPRFIDEDLR
jgi:hypothetical protein